MKVIVWTRPSIADLSDIRHWLITQAGGPIAARIFGEIRRQAEQFETFASLDPVLTSTRRKMRVSNTKYIIEYRIMEATIDVLRVHHVRRNWRPSE